MSNPNPIQINESDFVSENFFTDLDQTHNLLSTYEQQPNFWLNRFPVGSELNTVTPVLADYLNTGVHYDLIKLCKTYIAGTKFCPVIINSKSIQLPVGTWLSLNLEDNPYDEHAIAYRVSDWSLLKENQEKDYNTWYIAGHVEKNLTEKISKWFIKHNQLNREIVLSPESGNLNMITHSAEYLSGKIVRSKKTYDHYNYDVELYILKDVLDSEEQLVLNARSDKISQVNQFDLNNAIRKIENYARKRKANKL